MAASSCRSRGRSTLRRTAINSAVIATAISSGVIAPMSSPTGVTHAFKKVLRASFFLQFAKDCDCLTFRSNHADVAGLSLHRPSQYAHIVVMSTGHNYDVRDLTGTDFRHRFRYRKLSRLLLPSLRGNVRGWRSCCDRQLRLYRSQLFWRSGRGLMPHDLPRKYKVMPEAIPVQ